MSVGGGLVRLCGEGCEEEVLVGCWLWVGGMLRVEKCGVLNRC